MSATVGVDPMTTISPGSSVRQFDHLAERNLALYRRHRDVLESEATAAFPPPGARVTRLRVGVDTGGTFTDVVVLDEATGALTTTKTPSTPADPAQGFLTGADKALGRGRRLGRYSVFHGTIVATTPCSRGRSRASGPHHRGFRHLLEIGRQSVPDGYGNSYFWVKPTASCPSTWCGRCPSGWTPPARSCAHWTRTRCGTRPPGSATTGSRPWAACSTHANPAHEQRVRQLFAQAYPECSLSISSDVLREYREHERSVTTLVDAFVKPTIASYVRTLADRLAERTGRGVPFFVMKSNGGVTSAAGVAGKPITTVLSGPAAGAGAAAVTAAPGSTGSSPSTGAPRPTWP